MKPFLVLAVAVLIAPMRTPAQSSFPCRQGTAVTVSRECSGAELTPEEAKHHALELARAEAVDRTAGVHVAEELFRAQTELTSGASPGEYTETYSHLSRSTSYGKIVDERVEYSTRLDASGQPVYRATLQACVVEERNADPAFTVALAIERPVLFDRGGTERSDALAFSMRATRPCYLYLFNLLANDSVQLVLPNRYVPSVRYDPARTEQEYERRLRDLGMRFTVSVPEGMIRTKESLYCIALKDDVAFPGSGSGYVKGAVAAQKEIMQWLLRIPADRRTEAFQSYEIRKTDPLSADPR
ncbi:MAG: DUF4384 domain-containing protein [Acidobacteriota bacterium]